MVKWKKPSVRTDEFYSSVNIKDPELQIKLRGWEERYNRQRPHNSLQGKTPWEKYKELESAIPCLSKVQKNYIPSKEPFVMQNCKNDQRLKLIQKHNITSILNSDLSRL